MAITSTDIQEQSFKIERRGYDVDEVDVFLEHVASEIDALNNEVSQLRARLSEAERAAKEARAQAESSEKAVASVAAADGIDPAELAKKDAKIAELEARVRERKNEDAAIAQALIVAQRTGDELVSNAKAEAENTRQNAIEEGQRILEKANTEKQRIIDNINELNQACVDVRTQYQDLLKEFIGSAQRRLAEISGDTGNAPVFIPTESVDTESFAAAVSEGSYNSYAPSSATATYTTPTVSSVVSTPATPKPTVSSNDLSGYGDTDDTFGFDEID